MHDGNAVLVAIFMTDTFGRLTTDDVDDVGWTLDGTEAIPQAETEGVDHTSIWRPWLYPFLWNVYVPVRRLERVKGLDLLSGSNTRLCASISASFATSQEVSIRICDLLCDLLLRIPAAAT